MKKRLEIEALSKSKECTNLENWAFTAIGAKACGGPTGYIAYSLTVDTTKLLELISQYTSRQDLFNNKWGVISNCTLPQQPIGIECVDRKPVLLY